MHIKKWIVIILITLIAFNALLISPAYAGQSASNIIGGQSELKNVLTGKDVNQFGQNGTSETGVTKQNIIDGKNTTVSQKQDEKSGALKTEQDSFIASIFGWIIKGIAAFILEILNWISEIVSPESTTKGFEIEKLLFNDYRFFDINYFSADTGGGLTSTMLTQLKANVASWYYGIRTIAIVSSLCVLIYIAIRMALSTADAKNQGKYKQMLSYWLISMVILFGLHYLILIMINVSDLLVEFLRAVKGNIGLEDYLKLQISSDSTTGWQALGMSLLFFSFVYLQLKFLLIYFKRLIIAGFLIMISPLITVTYAIDRAGDGRAQAFSSWLKEMITTVFMQPMHALLFIIFAASAGEIAKVSIFVALLLLWSLSRAEGMFRNIFKLNGSSTIKSLKDVKIGIL